MSQTVKSLLAVWETWVWSLGQEDPLEKEIATHSSILAWEIPWMEEPCRLQSMGGKESDTTERLHSTLTKIKLFRNTLDGWKFTKMVTMICRSLSFFFYAFIIFCVCNKTFIMRKKFVFNLVAFTWNYLFKKTLTSSAFFALFILQEQHGVLSLLSMSLSSIDVFIQL